MTLSEFSQEPIGVSAVIDGLQVFGRKAQGFDDYNVEDDSYATKKRVRIRVPVIRTRTAKEQHAYTVVRRRPLVPYTKSPVDESSIEPTHSSAYRKVVRRTRIRSNLAAEVTNSLGDDSLQEVTPKTRTHRVTVTRKRKIRPTTTAQSTSHRERITRKKLVNVRPVVTEPTSTLAIITTGFYTAPSVDDNEEYDENVDGKILPTPYLDTMFFTQNPFSESADANDSSKNSDETSVTNEPIIITDGFFFPENNEETTTTTNENTENSSTESNTEPNDLMNPRVSSNTESDKVFNESITTENQMESMTTESVDEIATTLTPDIENSTAAENEETTDKITLVDRERSVNNSSNNITLPSKVDEKANVNVNNKTLNSTKIDLMNSTMRTTAETLKNSVTEDSLKVIPITSSSSISPSATLKDLQVSSTDRAISQNLNTSESIPTVIPLPTTTSIGKTINETKTQSSIFETSTNTSSSPPLTPEDIEAGLTDDLYLSLSRPDFLPIIPSKVESHDNTSSSSHQSTPELITSVYYSETIVTSTRLRTYTYFVTKVNEKETEVMSSTTVRPRVTSLTVTIPVTVTLTPTPTQASSSVTLSSYLAEQVKNNEEAEDEGRRFNLATRVMSNGVEVIVAGTTPAYRWENSNSQPTLTLSEAVFMLLPQDKPNEFVTKTCTTTFTYLSTITRDGTTIISTDQQVIANTATEERHRKPVSEAASVTLEASPTLQTEIFKTTYTYLTLNTDHPDEKNALGSSTRVIANTVTAPQYYLDMILEPSEAPKPETNTYLSTRVLEKTYLEDGKTKIEMTNDVVTQLIITESAPPSRPASATTTVTTSDESANSPTTDIAKTYYVTYTYYNTYLEKDSTVVKTNIATSSDIVYEKAPVKKTSSKSAPVTSTPEPIQIFATKTYLTTFTYFTTLLQAGTSGETSTTISSRTQVVENVITESIAPSLLDAGYMNALLTTSHHSDSLKNVVTGSTIIFFDDEEPISPTATNAFDASPTSSIDKIDNFENSSAPSDSVGSETNDATSHPVEPDSSYNEEGVVEETTSPPPSKKPSQVSNLLSLGSLGINSLTALGPVITAMADLLQGKTSATRRNDTEVVTEPPTTTTPSTTTTTTSQRSPIYIPVAEFVDGDIETAESQNIAALHLANSNHLPETRHKVASNLADGIPISPGEIITANSDVIIGKPGKMAPRPPQTFYNDKNIGLKPPPVSVPSVATHPILDSIESESSRNVIKIQKDGQQLEILPAHQIYEDHIREHVKDSAWPYTQQETINFPPNQISSKQDILENDPLLTPPAALPNVNVDHKNQHLEKGRYPWSSKDPLLIPNLLSAEKNRSVNSLIKSRVPEPIVHQVPHVIDRSTGQPLLVNIQPSQVANVVIPQGGTQALIFGDTNEPHISGQYFDDPSPYPEPEIASGYVRVDKVENQHYSKNNNLADYMTPPSLPVNFKQPTSSNGEDQSHQQQFSQGHDFRHINRINKPEKLPNRHHDNVDLSSGQGHLHTEILVHQSTENTHLKPQNRPTIPLRNYQTLQLPPSREHAKIFIPPKQTPPRRNEGPPISDGPYHDPVNPQTASPIWKNEKKPLPNSHIRRLRPTPRPRLPTRIGGYPYGRPTRIDQRPLTPIRQPPFPNTQRLPINPYQNELNHFNRLPSTVASPPDVKHQVVTPEIYNQADRKDKIPYSHQDSHDDSYSLQSNKNYTVQDSGHYDIKDYHLTTEYENKNSSSDNENTNNGQYSDKTLDSEVDASEDFKVISTPHDHSNSGSFNIDLQRDGYDSFVKLNNTVYFDHNINTNNNNNTRVSINAVLSHNNTDKNKQVNYGIMSDKNYDSFSSSIDSYNNKPTHVNNNHGFERKPIDFGEITNLKPVQNTPTFELNGHSRPFSKPNTETAHSEIKFETSKDDSYSNHYNQERPSSNYAPTIQTVYDNQENYKNESNSQSNQGSLLITNKHPPQRPQILTKSKLQVPGPVIISSAKPQKSNGNNKAPTMQFSLSIDSIGEENESNTQTERPPSLDTANKYEKPKEESLDTAFQTNFASADFNDGKFGSKEIKTNTAQVATQKVTTLGLLDNSKDKRKNQMIEELKPPPLPTDVFGLSPPPIHITTTPKAPEKKNSPPKITTNVSGLKPPPLYISLKETSVTPPPPSTNMVPPPSIKSSIIRPYLADILSQDMVPPPRENVKTTHPLEVATIRPGVAVSGSIQIATAVATSPIPVVQDMESKIPIVHGTVDLPVVVDVPQFLKPVDIRRTDSKSTYTVRPFETKLRTSVKPTSTYARSSSSSVIERIPIHGSKNSNDHEIIAPTKLMTSGKVPKTKSNVQEFSIVLEPSTDVSMLSTRIEPTDLLTVDTNSNNNKRTKQRISAMSISKSTDLDESSQIPHASIERNLKNQSSRKTDLRIKESASKMMEIIGTVVHEFIQNSTNERVEIKPQVVTHYETLTVTRTETSVVGSPPTTRTLLITHTLTSTKIETVTETLLHPTSVVSTITSTVLQSITKVPSYDHGNENDSIFVVMSDQNPPNEGAEEVEAEYGEEDVSRDEQNVSGNEIHRVLSGGILGAPSVPIRPPQVKCIPECKSSKSEICAETKGEMHCVCRPGFARLFPDRPCKPTYTFTMSIGLDKIGRERFKYDGELNDTKSMTFKRSAHPVKEALDRTLMQSDLRDVYRGLHIAKFLPNPMRVLFNVQFSMNTDEVTLKDVIRKYLVMSNYSLGGTDVIASTNHSLIEAFDFDECTNEDGGPHHDCSKNAACFNVKGTYQCSCKEGWADLSENNAYPGRICSQTPIGCAPCNNKGNCVINTYGQEVCECFPWYSGKKCQVNLKVLLIALITTGGILLGLLAVCLGLACLKNPTRRRRSADQRAMISALAGDTSSESSVAELAIPHHVPHILPQPPRPPPPQMLAPAPPMKRSARKVAGKKRTGVKKPAPVIAPVIVKKNCSPSEQRDRSLTVMIPRAKYRSTAQPGSNYRPMSTFALEEHKLMEYLEAGGSLGPVHPDDNEQAEQGQRAQKQQQQSQPQQPAYATGGALVSAGFQVSAQVRRTLDAESTLGGESVTEEQAVSLRGASLVRSCAETSVQASTKLLRLELGEAGSSLARSCAETSIQPASKVADSASEGHTMAERELGSTLRLPAQHAPLYHPDRTSTDRESNFDSL